MWTRLTVFQDNNTSRLRPTLPPHALPQFAPFPPPDNIPPSFSTQVLPPFFQNSCCRSPPVPSGFQHSTPNGLKTNLPPSPSFRVPSSLRPLSRHTGVSIDSQFLRLTHPPTATCVISTPIYTPMHTNYSAEPDISIMQFLCQYNFFQFT